MRIKWANIHIALCTVPALSKSSINFICYYCLHGKRRLKEDKARLNPYSLSTCLGLGIDLSAFMCLVSFNHDNHMLAHKHRKQSGQDLSGVSDSEKPQTFEVEELGGSKPRLSVEEKLSRGNRWMKRNVCDCKIGKPLQRARKLLP